MAWLALAAAGSSGRSIRSAASSSAGVAPGLTAKRQPWSREAWSWSRSSTVPEPTTTSGRASAIAAIAGERGLGTQRDLEHGEAAARQRLGEADRGRGLAHGQDGDDDRAVDHLRHARRALVGGVAHLDAPYAARSPMREAPLSAPPIAAPEMREQLAAEAVVVRRRGRP